MDSAQREAMRREACGAPPDPVGASAVADGYLRPGRVTPRLRPFASHRAFWQGR